MSFLTILWLINTVSSNSMNCGLAPYCGVLTLERGGGFGVYSHDVPSVHGLWPEIGSYGNSKCVIPPGNPKTDIPTVSCYTDKSFQQHEWETQGVCASNSSIDFFYQVCNLSSKPLQTITELKAKGYYINEMVNFLETDGYEIFNIDEVNDQLELSVCAGEDRLWKFSKVSEFDINCK